MKHLLSGLTILNVRLTEWLKYSLKSWPMIAKDRNIFSTVEGYKIPFDTIPKKGKGLKTCLGQFSSREYDGYRCFRNAEKKNEYLWYKTGKEIFEKSFSTRKK